MGKKKKSAPLGEKVVASNKRARHDYEIHDVVDAGLVLLGSEVKSLRQGAANIREAYGVIEGGEAFLVGAHISPYEQANRFNHEPMRRRKLLIKKAQIRRLSVRLQQKGYTMVAMTLYFKNGWAKIRLGLGKGRRLHDKRDAIRKRDQSRDLSQHLR